MKVGDTVCSYYMITICDHVGIGPGPIEPVQDGHMPLNLNSVHQHLRSRHRDRAASWSQLEPTENNPAEGVSCLEIILHSVARMRFHRHPMFFATKMIMTTMVSLRLCTSFNFAGRCQFESTMGAAPVKNGQEPLNLSSPTPSIKTSRLSAL